MPKSMISQLIDTHAKETPEKIALICGGLSVSYGDLWERVNNICQNLQKFNLTQQCLAIMLPNSVELVAIYLACFKLGIIATLINYHHHAADIAKILISTQATILIADNEKISEIRKINSTLDQIFIVGEVPASEKFESFRVLLKASKANFQDKKITADADAVIFHTSGSTGQPKGVVHTHKSVHSMLLNVNEAVKANNKTTMLIPLPLWHIGGFTHAMSKLMIGATCILPRHNKVDNQLFQMLAEYKPDMMILHVPCFYDLLYHPQFEPKYFQLMTECIAGGDKLPLELQKQFHAITGTYLRECYGMTEANLLTINRENSLQKCGSIGQPIKGVQIKLMKDAVQEVARGELGEIFCRGDNMLDRYWHNSAETSQKLVSGWLRTNDLARCDEEGFYWLCGRASELIHRHDVLISPLEVEELFYKHPAVKMVAVTGMDDLQLGEIMRAYVVLQPSSSLTPESLQAFVRGLDTNKAPDQIVLVSDLPRGKTGKINRHLLKQNWKE